MKKLGDSSACTVKPNLFLAFKMYGDTIRIIFSKLKYVRINLIPNRVCVDKNLITL
jgi:hypothetical protein